MTDPYPWQPDLRQYSTWTVVVCLIGALLLTPFATANSLALVDAEILFAGKDKVRLTKEGNQSLSDLTLKLQRLAGILSIRIIGHTDDTGDEATNQQLSQQRADLIKRHFQTLFPEVHIMSLGAGESIPFAGNHTDVGRARNQRVQIQVIATGSVAGTD